MRYSTCKYTVTLKPGLGSPKVIRTGTDRSATYDFLLTLHSNHGPISYRFRDRRRFQSKIAKFPYPRVFCTPAEVVPLGIRYRCWDRKTRMTGLPGRKRSLTISSAVWIQSTNVTDRHQAIASRGKTRSSADADNRRDAFSGQSRSTNMVPFWVRCDFSLSM